MNMICNTDHLSNKIKINLKINVKNTGLVILCSRLVHKNTVLNLAIIAQSIKKFNIL